MFSFEQEVLIKQYWGGREQERAGLLDCQSGERCAQWVTSKMMTAEDMRVSKITQRQWKEHEGQKRWYLRMDREGRGCTEDRRTQLEREKKSQARPMPSKPRNFQESIISNFPLNSRILWSQLTVVMIPGFAKRLIRKGKVQRFLEVDTLVSFNI